ncbi:YIP1 family protein, partial [Candidatus Sumerlaeota bacterium]|nr:YIP1 family protein [Candidatus Sumerlaeota bacterium]
RRIGFGFLSILSVLIWASVMPFVTAVIVHFCIILVGGAKEDFEATYRVSAYTFGASAILLIIPFCGPTLVYNCWRIIAIIVGIREIHRIESWRATLGVILPHIVAACCCLGFLFFAFGAIMRQLQQ